MFRNIQVEPCEFFGSAGINEDILRKSMDRMEEVPFDSDRKLMSTKLMVFLQWHLQRVSVSSHW